jgi:hypothetical protein
MLPKTKHWLNLSCNHIHQSQTIHNKTNYEVKLTMVKLTMAKSPLAKLIMAKVIVKLD